MFQKKALKKTYGPKGMWRKTGVERIAKWEGLHETFLQNCEIRKWHSLRNVIMLIKSKSGQRELNGTIKGEKVRQF
jgi:hypothetical protein